MNEVINRIIHCLDENTPLPMNSGERIDKVVELCSVFRDELESVSGEEYDSVEKAFIGSMNRCSTYSRLFILSFLLRISQKTFCLKMILNELMESALSNEERNFVYLQMRYLMFNQPEIVTDEIQDLSDRVYTEIVEEYQERLSIPKRIPARERNSGFVLVLTNQLLRIQHAPTKIVLDKCYAIQKEMGKDVLLVNIADALSLTGILPLYTIARANYLDEYCNAESISYRGIDIRFVQMDPGMPDNSGIQALMDLIAMYKPYQILMIGCDSVTMDICSMLVSTICDSLSANLTITFADYQVRGVKANTPLYLTEKELKWLKNRGRDERHVIPINLNYALDIQTQSFTREEIGIPENCMAGVVVGGRLNSEVTDDFLRMLDACAAEGLFVVFIGPFDEGYESVTYFDYPSLSLNSKCLGYAPDLLAVYDCMDLYINPYRSGGGTSAIEALHKGMPVVTNRYGDVYGVVGDGFAVGVGNSKDYESMKQEILRYLTDEEYYQEQSEIGKKTAEKMIGDDRSTVEMMYEFEKRMLEDEKNE